METINTTVIFLQDKIEFRGQLIEVSDIKGLVIEDNTIGKVYVDETGWIQ